MTLDDAKANVLRTLQAGPYLPKAGDDSARAVIILKNEGVPIVTEVVGPKPTFQLRHELAPTTLSPEQVKAARQRGLALALEWHRRNRPLEWRDLVQSIECPFERDAARDYLRHILYRMHSIAANDS